MNCIKCKSELADKAVYCHVCGKKQVVQRGSASKRANGTGSVYKQAGDKTWTAVKVLGYEALDNGKTKRIEVKRKGFRTKADAFAALPELGRRSRQIDNAISFRGVYELWLTDYDKRGRSSKTRANYTAAFKHFQDIWWLPFDEIMIDDLQECIDDCPHGKRTKQNMKTTIGLIYDYALPRGYLSSPLNLGRLRFVGNDTQSTRIAFTKSQLDAIIDSIDVMPAARLIYIHCLLGFHPHEFITLQVSDYHKEIIDGVEVGYFVAGEKTEAGIDRTVTVSPKIKPMIDMMIGDRLTGNVFMDPKGDKITPKKYRLDFYDTLDRIGIDNPVDEISKMKTYSPHCCRHTFATLIKNISAADKDKRSLTGHASQQMIEHYQHSNLKDLLNITDQI
jgi:integrase